MRAREKLMVTSGVKSLILYNWERMQALYGTSATEALDRHRLAYLDAVVVHVGLGLVDPVGYLERPAARGGSPYILLLRRTTSWRI